MFSDPPLVGAGCSRTDCHNHDFLPTECPGCNKLYCSDHYFRDDHTCKSEVVTNEDAASVSPDERNLSKSCGFEGCTSPCLESYVTEDVGQEERVSASCSRCSSSFCAQHRFPDSHDCKGDVPSKPERNGAAKALLAKNFPAHDMNKKQNTSRATGSTTGVKRRQKSQGTGLVALMKMRQSATPGDTRSDHVEMAERLHVQARVGGSDVYRTFWFRKSISTGRAFDLLQQRLEIPLSKSCTLSKEADESDKPATIMTVFDKPLSEQFEDGSKLTLTPTE